MTAPHLPALPDVGILALVPEPFDVPWMSRHQILSRLTHYFHVAWLNPARPWREVLRHPHRPTSVGSGAARPEGLIVHEPEPWLPTVYRPEWLERWTDTARLRAARKELEQRGCTRILLYLWRPMFATALDRVAHDGSLYHVVDEYTFSDVDTEVPAQEVALLQRADKVLIHSPGLMEKKGELNPSTRQLPNGVDFESVSAERSEPEDLRAIDRPRIGYCGWLKTQLDWELIEALGARHPEWSFVFAGGIARHDELPERLRRLGRRHNMHFLGTKNSNELMAYPRHFDVCIMPYRETGYTRYIYPLKLHEYLASGRPVVGTPIRTLQDFGDFIHLARGEDAWSKAIADALSEDSMATQRVEARRNLAKSHDWNAIAYQVARTLADLAGGDAPTRLSRAPVPEEWRSPPGLGISP